VTGLTVRLIPCCKSSKLYFLVQSKEEIPSSTGSSPLSVKKSKIVEFKNNLIKQDPYVAITVQKITYYQEMIYYSLTY